MKQGIHPNYRPARIVCACGNVIETRSTKGDFHVEICAACHPFFTGKEKLLDTAGRVERFRRKYEGAPEAGAKPAVKAAKAKDEKQRPKSLAERAAAKKKVAAAKAKADAKKAPAAKA